MNNPDNWVVLKVTSKEDGTIYKVLAGWSGSYLNGTSWQLNSGIVKVEEDGDYFLFHGNSGSVYKCHKESYGLRMSTAGVWHNMQERYSSEVKLMDENTDWLKLMEIANV